MSSHKATEITALFVPSYAIFLVQAIRMRFTSESYYARCGRPFLVIRNKDSSNHNICSTNSSFSSLGRSNLRPNPYALSGFFLPLNSPIKRRLRNTMRAHRSVYIHVSIFQMDTKPSLYVLYFRFHFFFTNNLET
jgi:hypothetical protein